MAWPMEDALEACVAVASKSPMMGRTPTTRRASEPSSRLILTAIARSSLRGASTYTAGGMGQETEARVSPGEEAERQGK